MTAYSRSIAGDQPRLASLAYQTNRTYAEAGVFYRGLSPGVLVASKTVKKSLAGSEPNPTGTLLARTAIPKALAGNQPASTGFLVAVKIRSDPQNVVYLDGPYMTTAQYTSVVRP